MAGTAILQDTDPTEPNTPVEDWIHQIAKLSLCPDYTVSYPVSRDPIQGDAQVLHASIAIILSLVDTYPLDFATLSRCSKAY